MSLDALQGPAAKLENRSQARELWRQFSRHKGAVVGMVVFLAIVLVVALGPFIYQVDASKTNVRARNLPPSIEHPFGTDNLGRDLLAQNLVGGRISLSVGLAAMIISVVVGMVVFLAIVLVVAVGPFIYQVDASKTNVRARNLPPSIEHPFGTDNLGRDLLAQNLVGGRISLSVGLAAMIISVVVGTVIGQLAGYYRRIDGILMRITDMFLALPILPLLLVAVLLFRDSLRVYIGPQAGVFVLIVVIIGVTSWMNTARVVRGEVLALKEREFVTAADALGARDGRVLGSHILPNIMSPILVSASLGMASAIITESALSFLGLGFPPDVPTWGRLLFDGRDYLGITPMRVVWPGMFISLVVLSINFMGDGIRDALDPKLRGRA